MRILAIDFIWFMISLKKATLGLMNIVPLR